MIMLLRAAPARSNGPMNRVKQIHAHALRSGLDLARLLLPSLLRLPNLPYAHALLLSSPTPPSTFLFNRLLQSHGVAPSLLLHMLRLALPLNPHSFTFLFSSPSLPLHVHRSLHSLFLKLGFPIDAHVATSLLHMYARKGLLLSARKVFESLPQRTLPTCNAMISAYSRSGRMEDAKVLFDAMPVRNTISWTSMVSGYAQNGKYKEAVGEFVRMREEGGNVRPNEVTIASVLPACANIGALELGRSIESYARENGFERNPFVANALVEMYAKCGSVCDALRVFEELGERRNLCSWNSMIVGLAVHGRWQEALDLFYEMRRRRVYPDDITFVGVLVACTHGGLVDQGRAFFESLDREFSAKPKLEHYGCMVDLLGRAGHLHEAYSLIRSMPMEPDSVVWGALLGACSFHNEVELAEIAAGFLFNLEPWNPGNYVIMSNIYASCGRWDDVAKLWKMKKWKQCRKAAGYSSFELGGAVHMFFVEDKSHPRTEEIYKALDEIHRRMKRSWHIMHLDDFTSVDPSHI